MGFAVGKFAKGLCDRCGFEYQLHDLREEWNNLKVCEECYEPKAPQVDPVAKPSDNEALYKARPNNDVEAGEGFVVVSDANVFNSTSNNFLSMNPSILGSNFSLSEMTSALGTVTITT